METNETFHYNYSAKEQEEIKAIRAKYTAPCEVEDKMTQLRRLDLQVTQKATVISLIFGVVGALVMGLGMSLVMTDIGKALGTTISMIIGIAIGILGAVLASFAYPVYNRIIKKEREKIAPEIIRLTDDLLK